MSPVRLAFLAGSLVVFGLGLARGAYGDGPTPGRGLAPISAPDGQPEPDALRSTIIYPPERISIRMDHSLRAHRTLRCVRCHEGAGRSARTSDALNPRESSCLPCHAERIERAPGEPVDGRCGYCHVGAEIGASVVPLSVFPDARLRFSHAAHVRFGAMKCLTCHDGVDESTVATRSHLPTMRSCFDCHGGAAARAPSECTTCHLAAPDGVLRTEWPQGSMNPKPWQAGMHHDREWLVRHRWVAADQGSACASCHREEDCTDCHDGRVRPARVHPSDYLTIHSQMARRNEPRCDSCHTTQTFCNECHARLGVSQLSAPRVRTGARFHPPAEVWSRGPVQHAVEARRSLSTCVSCHGERDCVACHGALGIGSGVSPHPPGFAASCQEHLARNARACRTCHGPAFRCP
jgi:hypothetical protein